MSLRQFLLFLLLLGLSNATNSNIDCLEFSKSWLTVDSTVINDGKKLACSDSSYALSSTSWYPMNHLSQDPDGYVEGEYNPDAWATTALSCNGSTGLYNDVNYPYDAVTIKKPLNLTCRKICSLCNPMYGGNDCPYCPKAITTIIQGCWNFECPSARWIIDARVVEGKGSKLECKAHDASKKTEYGGMAAWYLNGEEIVRPPVNCAAAEHIDCMDFSKIIVETSHITGSYSNSLTCIDYGRILSWSTGRALNLFCDYTTGLYDNKEKGLSIPIGDTVKCEKICTLCDPNELDSSCPGCTAPTLTIENDCMFLECPSNKWRKDGKVVDGKVNCGRSYEKFSKGEWEFGIRGVSKMGCSALFDCVEFSALTLDSSVITSGHKINCDDNFSVVRTSAGVFSTSFTCDDSTGLYKDGNKIVPRKAAISCHKICSLCAPYEFDSTCPGCAAPNLITIDQCKSMECPANKWRKDGGVVDGNVECKKDPADATKSTWFFGNELATKMGCSDKFDCVEFSKLTLDASVKIDSKNLTCTDSSSTLKTSTGLSSSSFTCNDSTGLYKDGTKIVPKGATLTCQKAPEEATDAQKNGNAPIYGAVGGVSALLLIAGIIAVVLIIRNRRQTAETKPVTPIEAAKSKEAPSSGAPSPASPSGGVPSSN